jgi:hypothetical protein
MQRLTEWKEVFATTTEPELDLLQKEQTTTFTSLSIMLSNHGSDWIEQSLGGGLTHVEFCNLDGQTMRGYIKDFREFDETLRVWRSISGYGTKKKESGANAHSTLRKKDVQRMRDVVAKLNTLLKARVQYEE